MPPSPFAIERMKWRLSFEFFMSVSTSERAPTVSAVERIPIVRSWLSFSEPGSGFFSFCPRSAKWVTLSRGASVVSMMANWYFSAASRLHMIASSRVSVDAFSVVDLVATCRICW
jgi:hypothetical protein